MKDKDFELLDNSKHANETENGKTLFKRNEYIDSILGFDTTKLSGIFNDATDDDIHYDDDNDDTTHHFIDEEYEAAQNGLYNEHIKKCMKYDDIYLKMPLNVYLAGKISKYDWRESLLGYRCGDLYGGDTSKYSLSNRKTLYKYDIYITGPWFISCDHGCYHGDNTHGLGINKLGCPAAEEVIYSEKDVYDICLKQIERSNIIFAYITKNTCYGTIYEISHAIAKGKDVIIIFDNEKLMGDMWFMCQGAKIVDTLGKDNIKKKFDDIMYKILIDSTHYRNI